MFNSKLKRKLKDYQEASEDTLQVLVNVFNAKEQLQEDYNKQSKTVTNLINMLYNRDIEVAQLRNLIDEQI